MELTERVVESSPLDYEDLQELIGDLGRRPLADTRLGRAQRRALGWAHRATTWRLVGPVAGVAWRVYRRDQHVAGSVMAAAIAYRLFIWALPLALVLVSGLGTSGTLVDASESALGPVAHSVADAANATSVSARVAILVTGTGAFLYESYVLLRALRAVSSFAWGIPVRPMRHAVTSTFVFLGVVFGAIMVSALVRPISDLLVQPFGWLLALAALVVVPLAYIVCVVLLLPHRAPGWTDLLPGAALFYVCFSALHLFNSLVLYPWLARKQATYGVLGVAAGLLFTLFVVGRAFEVSASLNAVLVEDRTRTRERDDGPAVRTSTELERGRGHGQVGHGRIGSGQMGRQGGADGN